MLDNNMSESVTEYGVDYRSLLYNQNSEDEQILPEELSGDQNAEKNVLVQSNAFSHKKASLLLSVTMLMKTVIGVGILSLPFVFSTMGIIPTIASFLLAGILIQFTSRLLIKSKNLSGHSNFSSIMRHLHNHKCFKIMASLLIMSCTFGSCVLDLMFFKRTVRKILEDTLPGNSVLNQFYASQYMILLVVAVIQFPITLLNKIEKLRIFSFIGILGIVVFIIAFVIDYAIKVSNNVGLRPLELFPSDWYKAASTVPNIIFSLAFNTNFFPIFKGLQFSSDKRMLKVVAIGMFTCIVFYLTFGFLGYSITKTTISANYLQSIKYSDTNQIIFILMNSGFLVSLLFAFPILFFSCRNNFILILKSLIEKQQAQRNWREEDDGQGNRKVANASELLKKKVIYVSYTFTLFIIIVLVAMFVNNIQSVFNLVGAVAASAVGFIFPMYFYIKLIYKKNKEKKGIYYFSIVLMTLMIFFCVFAVVALYI